MRLDKDAAIQAQLTFLSQKHKEIFEPATRLKILKKDYDDLAEETKQIKQKNAYLTEESKHIKQENILLIEEKNQEHIKRISSNINIVKGIMDQLKCSFEYAVSICHFNEQDIEEVKSYF